MTSPLETGPSGGPGQPDAAAWGVDDGYWDFAGAWRTVAPEVVQTVLDGMGAAGPCPPAEAPLVVVSQGEPWPDLPGGVLLLEDGSGNASVGAGTAPADLPTGYHRLERDDGGPDLRVAVCPVSCPSPPPGRNWGWSLQLYATRSEESWGIGDYADLRRMSEWAAGDGAGFVLVNPLHAPAPGAVPEASPYFPSSRCFLNPVYLRLEDLPGASELALVAELAPRARALNTARLIDRAQVWAYKSQVLEALFASFEAAGGEEAFDRYISERGRTLDGWTTFCALAEAHGLPWTSWPPEFRRPELPAVASFASGAEGRSRKRFHAWLQWHCEAQLASACSAAGLVCDLAVGVDGGGADAWLWQDTFALEMRVGAPPDEFNTVGQDWGLVPWDPWKLRARGYEPYIEVLRAVLRSAKGVRVDHVMGLFRLYWVPLGDLPTAGAYVRYKWSDMVNLLLLEASRAGAYVVGEDLGTVEDQVRETLGRGGVLSYRLLWFETEPPPRWPVPALGAVTTHDLPTVAGVWTGSDLEDQKSLGLRVNQESCDALRRRLLEVTGAEEDWPVERVIDASYAALGTAPCALLAAVLDDALAVAERPNMPGTIDQWPNWCLALPATIEQIQKSELAQAIAQHMNNGT